MKHMGLECYMSRSAVLPEDSAMWTKTVGSETMCRRSKRELSNHDDRIPGWLNAVPQFLSNLAQVIGLALGFTLDLAADSPRLPHPWLLALAVAVLAGCRSSSGIV